MRYIRHIAGIPKRLARRAVRVALIDCVFISGGAYMFLSSRHEDVKRLAEGIAFGFLISRWLASNVHDAVREFLRAEAAITKEVKTETVKVETEAKELVESEDFFD